MHFFDCDVCNCKQWPDHVFVFAVGVKWSDLAIVWDSVTQVFYKAVWLKFDLWKQGNSENLKFIGMQDNW